MIPARRSSRPSPRLLRDLQLPLRPSLLRRACAALLRRPRLIVAIALGAMTFLVLEPCWRTLREAAESEIVQIDHPATEVSGRSYEC